MSKKTISKMLFSKEKVELALVDDVKTSIQEMKKLYTSFSQTINQAEYKSKQIKSLADDYNEQAKLLLSLKREAQSLENKVENYNNSISKEADKIKRLYKELGQDVPSELLKQISDADKMQKEAKGLSSKIDIYPII
jgi:uncharacterized coiled-coil DUF342 family protein